MIVQVWEEIDSITVIIKGSTYPKIEEGAKLIREIEGKDWEECMEKHHDLMGWEPYKPF